MDDVIFADGTQFFKDLEKKYIKHSKGFFILAPSGAGKTYYCKNQKESNWIDGDDLWISSGAHPDYDWWNKGIDVINRIDRRSDVVTEVAISQGFWVMGASNYSLKPDAVVIPDWDTHVGYIKNRESNNYDGGATSDQLDQVKSHIEFMEKWVQTDNIPVYNSIDEAVKALTE